MPANQESSPTAPGTPVTKARAHTALPEGSTREATSTDCPECGGPLIEDRDTGGTVCDYCGIVLSDHSIDRGGSHYNRHPSDEGHQSPPPVRETLHDRGLSTTIDRDNVDYRGQSLSETKRRQFNRLRKRHRNQIISGSERRLRFAFGEISRMACALGISDTAKETAAALFRQIHDGGYVMGRCIESLTAATVYVGCRTHDHHHELRDVSTVSRTDHESVKSHYRNLIADYDLPIPLDHAGRHLPAIADALPITHETRQVATTLLESVQGTTTSNGLKPRAMAGAAVYAAELVTATKPGYNHLTQDMVAEAADCAPKTIQENYHKLLTHNANKLGVSPEDVQGMQPSPLSRQLTPPDD
jgi:transcription initiation factor TFIIB